jgi:hypothetical protein
MKKIIISIFSSILLPFLMLGSNVALTTDTTLGNFKVEDFDMGNMLTWETVREFENKEFIVERSTNGVNFVAIGTVKGQGTTYEPQFYNFLDISADKGTTTYRLRQVNLNGFATLSNLVTINKAVSNNFTVASITPLERQSIVEIVIDVKQPAGITYSVELHKGAMIYMATQYVQTGRNTIIIDISELEVGTYKISLQGENETESIIFKTTEKKKVEAFADFDEQGIKKQ